MDEKKYLYISGPITGVENYKENFKACEDWIRKNTKYEPINPAFSNNIALSVEGNFSPKYEDYMRVSFLHMTLHPNTSVVFLPGWFRSNGSFQEDALASVLGYKKMFFDGEKIKDVPEDMLK